jgi:hypothetical protein
MGVAELRQFENFRGRFKVEKRRDRMSAAFFGRSRTTRRENFSQCNGPRNQLDRLIEARGTNEDLTPRNEPSMGSLKNLQSRKHRLAHSDLQ